MPLCITKCKAVDRVEPNSWLRCATRIEPATNPVELTEKMARGVEREEKYVIGEERQGELSVMLSVCGAGSDKRGGIQS